MKTPQAVRGRWALRFGLASAVAAGGPPATRVQSQSEKPAPAGDPRPSAEAKVDSVVAELVAAHNRERAEAKLPPLRLEAKLEAAAAAHAKDMADHETMSHDGSDKSTPAQRVERAGYIYRKTGENVAWGQPDVATVMRGWMDSPHHKENILGDFTEIGVARATAANGAFYWSASFGKPPLRLVPAEAAAALVKQLDAERAKANRPAFQVDPILSARAESIVRAQAQARDDGKSPPPASFEGLDTKPYKTLAMSLAAGQPTADEAVRTWLDSPDHKKAILGDPTRVGAAYACSKDGTASWCLILAVPAK